MQPTNLSSRILLPVKLWFVYLSLVVALGLEYIPTGRVPGIPDWVALVLAIWCVREPLRIGMGVGFVFGLLVDVGQGAAMGQHALAYVVLAYVANGAARRVLWFPLLQQAIHMLPLFLLIQVLMLVVRVLAGAEFPGWSYFLSSLSSALLWAPLSILLMVPQYQPVDRDDNRPI
ncbi:Rod shape-determining protein MreD [Thauera humireducens]|jgi:rod shape-determining protein MreD|uniref:rod shape-determining protein MreD n=1 Tax=Thauera humireducens TaxID=1134435 RepID=UPI002467A8C0|nr:rod shape-determining protein MreD [Thauera humireducens]CAH1746594.1 Rod shape-determining protein MreD [Thauera humireducens]